MPTAELESKAELDLARECLYRFLALALTSPHEPDWPCPLGPDDQRLALESAALLRDEADFRPEFLSFGERSPDNIDLVPLLTELNRPLDHLKAEYDRVFGLVIPKECPPYETEYYPASEAFQRSQQLADVAGYYRAFGLEPSSASPERHDHITLELEFMAFVLMKKRLASSFLDADGLSSERVLVCEQVERSFLKDHLSWWVPAFAAGLLRKSGSGLYHELARILSALVPAERYRLDVPAPFQPSRPELIEFPEQDAGCSGCSAHP